MTTIAVALMFAVAMVFTGAVHAQTMSETLEVTITFADASTPSVAVPELAIWAAMALGVVPLVGLGWLMNRRARTV